MKAKSFNPYEWIPTSERILKQDKLPEAYNSIKSKRTSSIEFDIEVIVSRIESFRIDLTLNYQDWLKIGFGLADALGEAGRGYFHRVSCFHPDYSYQACNLQFDKCQKRNVNGATIKSFFRLAKEAGIDIRV